MITASRDILSTVARKNRILQPYLAIAPLFSLLCRDEDEKSPSHRISQLDICACIHHLPRLRVIAIPFPSRIYSDWFSLDVLFTTISKNSPLNFSSGQKCIFRAQSNEIVRLFFERRIFKCAHHVSGKIIYIESWNSMRLWY